MWRRRSPGGALAKPARPGGPRRCHKRLCRQRARPAGGRELLFDSVELASEELGAPHQRDTRFKVHSTTKPVTATAIRLLIGDGKLALDLARFAADHAHGFNVGTARESHDGLRWVTRKRDGRRVIRHDGGNHGFVAALELWPADGLGVVVASNHGFFEDLTGLVSQLATRPWRRRSRWCGRPLDGAPGQRL